MDFDKIKLVIWDLDNTFWSGTISEGEIQPIKRNIELILSLTDCGIINSVCSKNKFDVGAGKLEELTVFKYFVFPSIEWTPKGQRVRDMIKTMSLRAENVLFIDDEITNLEEAKHYSPGIMVAGPEIIPFLSEFVASLEKKDKEHTRLEQYKLLEKKEVEQKKYNSNVDFLLASNIRVDIIEDCDPELERIHELILRSNQLNFTKKRIKEEELKALFKNKDAKCAYVKVNDKYGDYGIVGFYAVMNRKLEHFIFSCRTIGLGIEQYVYSKLDYPHLEVVGEVVSLVNKSEAPLWVNKNHSQENLNTVSQTENLIFPQKTKFLFKSACDFSQMIAYVKGGDDLFHCEFNYVNAEKKNVIEGHNHSINIEALNEISAAEKQEILNDCVFVDEKMFEGTIYKKKYEMIFMSSFSESYAGIYKKKNSNIHVTAGSYLYPLTDKSCWDGLINKSHYSSNNRLTEEYLNEFSEKYEFLGKTNPADYRKRINKILSNLDKQTKLCLILGVEFPCENNTDLFFKDRHISHALLNKEIRDMARNNNRLVLFDLNDTVKNQEDFTDNMNQFTSRVNYELSLKMSSIINQSASTKIDQYNSLYIYFDILLNYTRRFVKKIIPTDSDIYKKLHKTYYKLSRNRK